VTPRARGDHRFTAETLVARPRHEVFSFFADAENLERITPPELSFRIRTPLPISIREGALIDYRLGLFGVPFTWKTRISRWEPETLFVDEQLSGPYAKWIHTHRFEDAPGGTLMRDEVLYRLPLFPAGELAHPLIRLQLRRIFAYRGRRIRALLG
jgi:ligand-binding SRPBCC domain-containing protein